MKIKLLGIALSLCTVGGTLAILTAQAGAVTFHQEQKTVSMNGRTLTQPFAFAASDGSTKTTYMPIWYVGQALQASGFAQSWNAKTHTWTLTTSSNSDMSSISLGTGNATIVVNGHPVKKVNTYIAKDPAAGPSAQDTVYMPIYYVQQIFDAAGIDSSWDGQTWSITSSAPLLFGFVTNYGGSPASLNDLEAHPEVSEFSAFTHAVTTGGEISGELDADAAAYAQSHQLEGYVTVTNIDAETGNFNGALVHQLLSDPTCREELLTNMVGLVQNSAYSGINVDFEMMASADGQAYTNFLTDLGQKLHAAGKKLSVDVPAVTAPSQAYNYAQMGLACDEVIIMAYDDHYPGGDPGAIAPTGWVDKVLSYATSVIAPNKILLGMPMYGYDWYGASTKALTLSQVDNLLQTYNITPLWDAQDEAPYFSYQDQSGTTHTVFYENEQSISAKLALATKYHLRGVSLWKMGLENDAVWPELQQYLAQR